MKKKVTCILAAVLILSLAACGSKEAAPTKDEMLETAGMITIDRLRNDITENIITAKENYLGKTYVVPCVVTDLTEDSCMLSVGYSQHPYSLKAALPAEELKQIHVGEVIKVVGQLSAIEDQGDQGSKAYISMEPAYLYDTSWTFSGSLIQDPNCGLYYIKAPVTSEDAQRIEIDESDLPTVEIDMADFMGGVTPADVYQKSTITISGSDIFDKPYYAGSSFKFVPGQITMS